MSTIDGLIEKYTFHPYNKKFPSLYRKEAKILKRVLSNAQIEHVGSTAVPGLGGKGIIDIAIKTSRNKRNQFIHKLEKLGYEHNPEHPRNNNRIFFQKIIKYHGKERRIHVHLALNNYFWNSFIVVRDYLRTSDEESNRYAKIKKEAVKYAKGEGKKYRSYKSEYLESLSRKALKGNNPS